MNEITIIRNLQTILNSKFDTRAGEIATQSGVTKRFNITNFTEKSLKDGLINHEEFGTIYVSSNNVEVTLNMGVERAIINRMSFDIRGVFLSQSEEDMIQAYLVRSTLIDIISQEDYEDIGASTVQIESIDPVEFQSPGKNGLRYNSSGIIVSYNIGF